MGAFDVWPTGNSKDSSEVCHLTGRHGAGVGARGNGLLDKRTASSGIDELVVEIAVHRACVGVQSARATRRNHPVTPGCVESVCAAVVGPAVTQDAVGIVQHHGFGHRARHAVEG